MKSLPRRSTAASHLDDIVLGKDAYDADLQVNERAQVFTTEIARVGLLAIGGIGFLLINPQSGEFRSLGPDLLLIVPTLSLGVAVGTALIHRYFSTDCIVCQIAILRLIRRLERTGPDAPERGWLENQLDARRNRQERDMRCCRRLTLAAASSLATGVVGIVFIVVLI